MPRSTILMILFDVPTTIASMLSTIIHDPLLLWAFWMFVIVHMMFGVITLTMSSADDDSNENDYWSTWTCHRKYYWHLYLTIPFFNDLSIVSALLSHRLVIYLFLEIWAIGYLTKKCPILPIFMAIASNRFEHINIYTP